MTEPKCEFLSQNPGASLIFVNFGTPPHYLGLQKYTRECVKSRLMVRIGQNRPTFRVISAKKIHQLDKSTASAAVLTNMSKVRAEAGFLGSFGTCCHPISLTKEENFITAAKGLASLPICSSESQLQMVWGTGLAKSRLCPPGSLVTQLGKLRNRQIVVLENCPAHIAAPLRGWTSW